MNSKMKTSDWITLYAVTGFLDLLQFLIDFLPPAGEVINEVLDVFIGFCLGYYFQHKGVSMAKPGRIIGLIVAFIGEEMTAASFPLWILDVAYMNFTVIAENRGMKNVTVDTAETANTDKPLNNEGIRQPSLESRQPLNKSGIRSPQ
jgi:hypothetical protein